MTETQPDTTGLNRTRPDTTGHDQTEQTQNRTFRTLQCAEHDTVQNTPDTTGHYRT